MWWFIIQRFPRCRNPFMAIFNGLHGKDNGSGKMNLSDSIRAEPHRGRPDRSCYSVGMALRSRRILNQ